MTEPLHVIALCGHARSGKDTLARYLVAEHDYFRIALADGVRSLLNDLDGQTWDFRKERAVAGQTDRTAQQLAGTECRNDVQDVRHWVNHALMKIRFASHFHPVPRRKFVVTDLRYPYEAEWMEARIGEWFGRFEAWRIDRPGLVPITESGHSSEREIMRVPVNAVLRNDGPKSQLFRVAAELLREGAALSLAS